MKVAVWKPNLDNHHVVLSNRLTNASYYLTILAHDYRTNAKIHACNYIKFLA
jgi:hypothetical protein